MTKKGNRQKASFQRASQKYLKFPGLVILNHALMKIRVVSGSHQIGPIGEMLKRIQHDGLF